MVRSRKTTNSRGFAYVEFQYPEVAQIAAESLNNYMMFKKIVKTVYIPPAEQKFNLFKSGQLTLTTADGKQVLTSRYQLKRKALCQKYNRDLDEEELKKRDWRTQTKIQKLKDKMTKYNIDYDIDLVAPKINFETEGSVKSESDSDVESPEKLEFEEGSDSEKNEFDSDESDDQPDPVSFKKKSIKVAKRAAGELLLKKKPAKVEKTKLKKEKLIKAAKEVLKSPKGVKLVKKPKSKNKK